MDKIEFNNQEYTVPFRVNNTHRLTTVPCSISSECCEGNCGDCVLTLSPPQFALFINALVEENNKQLKEGKDDR